MTQSDYIALAAMGVASLSAIYAKWSANEAKRANLISLQVHKIEIYEEVIAFSDCFRGLFCVPTAERLETFKKKAVQRAEIYLSEEVHHQLMEIYDHCSKNETWLGIAERAEAEGRRTEDIPHHLEVRSEYKLVLNLLYPVIQSIKREARLDYT